MFLKKLLLLSAGMFLGFCLFAQNNIKGVLVDESTGEPLGFATVSITREGQTKPAKYALTDDKGGFTLESVRNGNYSFSAELLGYEAYSSQLRMASKTLDLGKIQMKVDREQLEAAEVSAVGNAVTVKKDTVEYNASSFLSTDNDNLVDLLKKMPGIEVADDGTITHNGQTISKITLQGKTFFLDDPQIASQNIPAKLIRKLKVIRKKSEQAEFTGIDDGQEETVIDLSVQPGMMKGLVGRITAGGGHDLPAGKGDLNDWRYSGNAFIGRFTDKTQISVILNANNANVQGSTNFSGGMMGGGGGRGGGFGGSGGITSSYMAGLNAATEAFDGKMQVGGNYNFNHNDNDLLQETSTINYLTGMNQMVSGNSANTTHSNGHNFGLRLEHKFSENTSILFEPRIRFGNGNYVQSSTSETRRDNLDGTGYHHLNDAYTNNSGANKNFTTSGFFLFRQRLGIPGRTLTANVNFNLSNNDMDALNKNGTTYYQDDAVSSVNEVNQHVVSNQKSYSVNSRVTYTEPLGNYFYVEANYSFNWSKSVSDKTTYDLLNGGNIDYDYSNSILSLNRRQEIGANVLFQNSKLHLQAGFSAMPQYTYKNTAIYDSATGVNTPRIYEDNRWNYSPQVMMFFEMSENSSLRFFYRGTSSQPSTEQLMPVPDNTNPLRVSFGNPTLTPYFSHNINGEFRYNNRERFASFNARFNGGFTQNQISSLVITGSNGGQYTMPFNAPSTGNAGVNFFGNFPFGKSAFSVNTTTGVNWRQSFAYEGVGVDMSKYTEEGFYEFMNWFVDQFNDPAYYKAHIVENFTDNLNFTERLRFTYRGTALQATLGGSTNMSQTWYTQKGDAADKATKAARNSQTWNNAVTGELTWNWTRIGLSLTADANYRWYNGYTTPVDPQTIINLRVAKTLGSANLSLYVADLLGQSRALRVSDASSQHVETLSNTLGRYVILSFSYNFGSFGRGRGGNRGGGNFRGGPGGGPGGMPPMGGGRPPMM